MAYTIRRNLINLEFPDNPNLNEMQVKVRSDVTLNTLFSLQTEMASGDPEKMREGIRVFASEVLSSWDITQDDGTILPADDVGMGMLPIELATAIISRWGESVAKVGEDSRLIQNGSSPSGADLIATVSQ
tara:strand:+ start:648 stop:1037 length:390 start_codon:yes stop_codon:yes gene_type:complete